MEEAYIYLSICYVLTLQQKDSETIQVQQLLEKIDDYENQIEDYKSALDKVNKVRYMYWYFCFGMLNGTAIAWFYT